MHWFMDFDDTLVVGPVTWALENAFPRLIAQHNLPYDKERFDAEMLRAQARAHQELGVEMQILNDLFTQMGWPPDLESLLVEEIFDRYRPSLFDDTIPFLEKCKAKGEPVYVISNNDHAAGIAEGLNIRHYFQNIFTPRVCGDVKPKPHRDMWDYVLGQKLMQPDNRVGLIGDDPWSEGVMADACGLECWIVDRMGRFKDLQAGHAYHWVKSLSEIEFE